MTGEGEETSGEEEAIAEAVRAETDAIIVPDELLAEPSSAEKNLLLQIREMGVPARIKLALRGNREARMLLLRDSNRVIRRLVLQNPRITDEEIIVISKNRTADDELLRSIADERDWMKNYQVRLGLVSNPKTPLVIALRLVSSLHERDLRQLAKSKNVSGTVANQAKRILFSKGPSSGH